MTRRVVRLASDGPPLLDIFSAGRAGSPERLSLAQVDQIRRTVRRVPEVMVKVTGGGRSVRAVVAHLAYISHHGEMELDTDRGQRVPQDRPEELLKTWHLEVSAGQYRGESYALRAKLDGVVRELSQAQTISDPARARLLKTREAVVAGWNAVAAKLEAQGEIVLGGEVRYFAMHLPPVLTDRERLAAELLQYAKESRSARTRGDERVRDRTPERTR